MATNQAAWLDGKGSQLQVREAPMPQAEEDNVVVHNKAIAINPVDWKVQKHGYFMKSFPVVLGEDIAGEVVEVGSNVKHIKKGDRVISHLHNLVTQKPTDAGFALYTSCPAVNTSIIPKSVSYAEGAVLPLAFDTAAHGLYSATSEGFLGLPLASLDPKPLGKVIIVWGGSSSVGALTIQLAVASGAKVIATSSPRNFDFCEKCGASEVFDYKDSSIADHLVKAVKSGTESFAGIYDAISMEDSSYKSVVPILEKLGGGSLAVVLGPPKEVPSSIKVGNVFAVNPIVYPLWADYITPALQSGKLKCLPEPMVIGKGLEYVQKGMDENEKGVSAAKVVIEL